MFVSRLSLVVKHCPNNPEIQGSIPDIQTWPISISFTTDINWLISDLSNLKSTICLLNDMCWEMTYTVEEFAKKPCMEQKIILYDWRSRRTQTHNKLIKSQLVYPLSYSNSLSIIRNNVQSYRSTDTNNLGMFDWFSILWLLWVKHTHTWYKTLDNKLSFNRTCLIWMGYSCSRFMAWKG